MASDRSLSAAGQCPAGGQDLLDDPKTKLTIRCEVVDYANFPAVEWMLYLRNEGPRDTPILSDIQPLDAAVADAGGGPCVLHYAKEGIHMADDYAPQEHALVPGGTFALRSSRGRSSDPGLAVLQSANRFAGRDRGRGLERRLVGRICVAADGTVRIRAGMPGTHLKLHPGEEIRTPRMLLLFWEGERMAAQNLLRRFILAHHTRLPAGMARRLPICFAVWGEQPAATHLATIRWLADNHIPVDNYWIDAGWYGNEPRNDPNMKNSLWWQQVGCWWPDKVNYPQGLKPIGDLLRQSKRGFTLWLEPERGFAGSDLVRRHPEWLLGPLPTGRIGDNYMLNLGLPAAHQAMTDLVSSLVTKAGVTVYRQDCNFGDLAPTWRLHDVPDRVGMTEILHIEGLYAFWDTPSWPAIRGC